MEIHSSESTTDEAQIRYDCRDFTFHCLKKIPNNFLNSLDLERISAVFSTPPPPALLWMQYLFRSQSAHRHFFGGFSVLRCGPYSNVVLFCFSGFQRTLFAAAVQKSPFTSRSLQQITFFSKVPQVIQLRTAGARYTEDLLIRNWNRQESRRLPRRLLYVETLNTNIKKKV